MLNASSFRVTLHHCIGFQGKSAGQSNVSWEKPRSCYLFPQIILMGLSRDELNLENMRVSYKKWTKKTIEHFPVWLNPQFLWTNPQKKSHKFASSCPKNTVFWFWNPDFFWIHPASTHKSQKCSSFSNIQHHHHHHHHHHQITIITKSPNHKCRPTTMMISHPTISTMMEIYWEIMGFLTHLSDTRPIIFPSSQWQSSPSSDRCVRSPPSSPHGPRCPPPGGRSPRWSSVFSWWLLGGEKWWKMWKPRVFDHQKLQDFLGVQRSSSEIDGDFHVNHPKLKLFWWCKQAIFSKTGPDQHDHPVTPVVSYGNHFLSFVVHCWWYMVILMLCIWW